MDSDSSTIPLPSNWPEHVKTAFLFALGMAHMGMAHVRGWCANSPVTQVGLRGDNERLRSEVELLREELRIKDARMARIPARHDPAMRPQTGSPSFSSRPAVAGTNSRPPMPS